MQPATSPRTRRSDARLLVLPAPEDGSLPGSRETSPTTIADLPHYLQAGDLLVLNDAATMPASLMGVTATGQPIELRLLGAPQPGIGADEVWQAALLGAGDWRTATEHRPPPPSLQPGDRLYFGRVAGTSQAASAPVLEAEVVQVAAATSRLIDVRFFQRGAAFLQALYALGKPIQYSYLKDELRLWSVQTVYSARPWAAEMPSAGFPLSWQILLSLRQRGVELAWLTHAAGISSSGDPTLDRLLPLPERYDLPAITVAAIERARRRGGRIIAVGTTVVRALEGAERSARQAGSPVGTLRPGSGLTSLLLDEHTGLAVVDGLLTGMHGPGESHFHLLSAFASKARLAAAWERAGQQGYLCHEFGDLCLLWSQRAALDFSTHEPMPRAVTVAASATS